MKLINSHTLYRTSSSSSKQPAQRNTIQTYFNRRLSGSVDAEAAAPAGPSDAEASDAAGSLRRQNAAGQGDLQHSNDESHHAAEFTLGGAFRQGLRQRTELTWTVCNLQRGCHLNPRT